MKDEEFQKHVIKEMCLFMDTTLEKLRSNSRKREIVQTRIFITYYLYFYTYIDLSKIGAIFDRSRSISYHYLNMIENSFNVDPRLQKIYYRTKHRILSPLMFAGIDIHQHSKKIEKYRNKLYPDKKRISLDHATSAKVLKSQLNSLREKHGFLIGDTAVYGNP